MGNWRSCFTLCGIEYKILVAAKQVMRAERTKRPRSAIARATAFVEIPLSRRCQRFKWMLEKRLKLRADNRLVEDFSWQFILAGELLLNLAFLSSQSKNKLESPRTFVFCCSCAALIFEHWMSSFTNDTSLTVNELRLASRSFQSIILPSPVLKLKLVIIFPYHRRYLQDFWTSIAAQASSLVVKSDQVNHSNNKII